MRKAAYFCIALFCVFAMVGTTSAQIIAGGTPWGFNIAGHATMANGVTPAIHARLDILCATFPGPSIVRGTIFTEYDGDFYWSGPDYIPAGAPVNLFIFGSITDAGLGIHVSAMATGFNMPDPQALYPSPTPNAGSTAQTQGSTAPGGAVTFPAGGVGWILDGVQEPAASSYVGPAGTLIATLLNIPGYPCRLQIAAPNMRFIP